MLPHTPTHQFPDSLMSIRKCLFTLLTLTHQFPGTFSIHARPRDFQHFAVYVCVVCGLSTNSENHVCGVSASMAENPSQGYQSTCRKGYTMPRSQKKAPHAD